MKENKRNKLMSIRVNEDLVNKCLFNFNDFNIILKSPKYKISVDRFRNYTFSDLVEHLLNEYAEKYNL